MNIYEKLTAMRLELQSMDIKKSGINKFAGYDYMELGDFLPHINRLLDKHKAASVLSFTAEVATLMLVDAEKPDDRIAFTSPMSSVSLKGCHDVQNLGAVHTYMRRYMYMIAFEIVENDELDATTGKPRETARPQETGKPAQGGAPTISTVYAVAKASGYSEEEVAKHCVQKFGNPLEQSTADQRYTMLEGYKTRKKAAG